MHDPGLAFPSRQPTIAGAATKRLNANRTPADESTSQCSV
jgi:hypothetical protein